MHTYRHCCVFEYYMYRNAKQLLFSFWCISFCIKLDVIKIESIQLLLSGTMNRALATRYDTCLSVQMEVLII